MESLGEYSEENQKNIMATLGVVHAMGYSSETDDKYQFHIILGSNIRSRNSNLKQLEDKFEDMTDELNQKVKDVKDLKKNLEQEREINQELAEDLKRSDEEISHLKKCVKNRDDITDNLNNMFKDKTDEIEHLKENCDSLAKQVGKELILEKKLEIQNKVIKELKVCLNEVEEAARIVRLKESEQQMSEIGTIEKKNELKVQQLNVEIGNLETENEEKVKQLNDVITECKLLKEQLHFIEEEKKQKVGGNESLRAELRITKEKNEGNFCGKSFEGSCNVRVHTELEHDTNEMKLKDFMCEQCGEKFKTRTNLNSHLQVTHEETNENNILKNKSAFMES